MTITATPPGPGDAARPDDVRADEQPVRRWLGNVADQEWTRCPTCSRFLHQSRLRRHLGTCPGCGRHFPVGSDERLRWLADRGSWSELDAGMQPGDPLGFVDSRPYPDRVAALRARTGRQEAARYGTARVAGRDVVLCVLDFAFQGGSMGAVVGEKVARAADHARRTRAPLLICSTSGGARMQEGLFALMQMARTAAALQRLRDAGVLYASLLADPVYGGVSASFAMLGDVIIAEPGARVGFAGPSVIRQTIRQELPEGFQSAEFLLRSGHIDAVVPRGEQRAYLGRLLAVHSPRGEAGSGPGAAAGAPSERRGGATTGPTTAPRTGAGRDAWSTVQLARHQGRPNSEEYLALIMDDFVALHGDRSHEDDGAVIGGPASLGGRPVMVIGHRKGRGTQDNISRNFGMPHPSGYRKAARLLRYAERLRLPVVTFIDTPGAYPGVRAEQENQSGAIAENLVLLAGLRTPVVAVVIGEGGSGGALALGLCDRLLMLENSVYSVISPEGCAAILFKDSGRAAQAAAALRLTATELEAFGLVHEVVPEPDEGAHAHHENAASALRTALERHLDELASEPVEVLLEERHRQLGRIGRTALHGAGPGGLAPARARRAAEGAA